MPRSSLTPLDSTHWGWTDREIGCGSIQPRLEIYCSVELIRPTTCCFKKKQLMWYATKGRCHTEGKLSFAYHFTISWKWQPQERKKMGIQKTEQIENVLKITDSEDCIDSEDRET